MEMEVVVALVFGVLGFMLSLVDMLLSLADKRAQQKLEAARRSEVFESISGSELMATTSEFKLQHGDNYYRQFRIHRPRNVEIARSKLSRFWKVTIELYTAGGLPKSFFDRGDWLRWGDTYLKLVEPIDVANYYHLGFFEQNEWKEYDCYRPKQHEFLQSRWRTIATAQDTVDESMEWCIAGEQTLRGSRYSVVLSCGSLCCP